ncbi:MAG: hypothetical protein ACRDQ0_08895, partial [Pseudonocardia sp.]
MVQAEPPRSRLVPGVRLEHFPGVGLDVRPVGDESEDVAQILVDEVQRVCVGSRLDPLPITDLYTDVATLVPGSAFEPRRFRLVRVRVELEDRGQVRRVVGCTEPSPDRVREPTLDEEAVGDIPGRRHLALTGTATNRARVQVSDRWLRPAGRRPYGRLAHV